MTDHANKTDTDFWLNIKLLKNKELIVGSRLA
jgi:hypothetical protein